MRWTNRVGTAATRRPLNREKIGKREEKCRRRQRRPHHSHRKVSYPRGTHLAMQPPYGDELRWAEAVELYYDGTHAKEVCRRYGISRITLSRWCNWIDFRMTWVDPDRQPPVPYPAPDYAPCVTSAQVNDGSAGEDRDLRDAGDDRDAGDIGDTEEQDGGDQTPAISPYV